MDRDWASGLVVGVGELAIVQMLKCCSSSCLIRNRARKVGVKELGTVVLLIRAERRMYRDALEATSRSSAVAHE